MANEVTSPVDNQEENQSNSVLEVKEPKNPDDKVEYKTYSKVLGEAKAAKLENERLRKAAMEASELREKLQAKELEEMEKAGKTQEALDALKSTLKQSQEEIKKEKNKIMQSVVSSSIKAVAIKHGCVNPEKLLRLLDRDDIAQIDMDLDNYSVNESSIEALIEKAKRDHDDIGLFKRSSVSVKDGVPKNTNTGATTWQESYQKGGFLDAFKSLKNG